MVLKTIKKAKDLGYYVDMYFVGLENADVAVKRVFDRVKQGGHGVKEEDIRRRYIKSQWNLIKAIQICNEVQIYDNTVSFIRIAAFKDGRALFQYRELGDSWFKKLIQENQYAMMK